MTSIDAGVTLRMSDEFVKKIDAMVIKNDLDSCN